jgi:hypothetical protein
MINSIQQFTKTGIPNLEKLVEKLMKDPKDIASFINGSQAELMNFLCNFIGEVFTECDQCLRDSKKRRQKWEIVRRDVKSLITSVGEVHFEKTLFKEKEGGGSEYLLDRIMGIAPGERITEDACERLFNEAVQTSYRRAGEELSIGSKVSKQTVKNKLHNLKIPPVPIPARKKVVDYLYIDADEDHVALQFKNKKGDLIASANGYKYNSVLAKLVYVYEGVEKEAPRSNRHRLINPHYFSGVYSGKDNEKLWDLVYEYLDSHYELSKVKKIYLNSDGGAWIKAVSKRFNGITKVLDGFHLGQYLIKMTRHLGDSGWDARNELRVVIKDGSKDDFIILSDRILEYAESASERMRIIEGRDYILNNWSPAKARIHSRDKVCGCSAEGHVSHVLSGRMSSRPMGWSVLGVDKMAHLRAYYWNKRNMLDLVRYQKKELPLAAGGEEIVLSASDMFLSERSVKSSDIWYREQLGKYSDAMRASVSLQTKKQAMFNAHIWGL